MLKEILFQIIYHIYYFFYVIALHIYVVFKIFWKCVYKLHTFLAVGSVFVNNAIVPSSSYHFILLVGLTYSQIITGLYACLGSTPLNMLVSLIILSLLTVVVSVIFINIYFISITFVIIYIGAIMILFLFIIMMFNLRNETSYKSLILTKQIPRYLQIGICSLLLTKLYFWVRLNIINIIYNNLYFTNFSSYQYNNIKFNLQYYYKDIYIFSDLLYTQFAIPLILISIIMLIAMFGSISLILKIQKKQINYEKSQK